jgi:glycosyltransferase involved in cell wall biosynthesis
MRDAFRARGHEAEVFALEIDAGLEGDVRSFSSFRPGGPGDVVILHYALPSPLSEALRVQGGRRVLIHHNITPPQFFSAWDAEMERICAIGRSELPTLAAHVDLALGDSEFNRMELEAVGFRRTGVLPIYLDFQRYREEPGPVLRERLGDGRTNALFVGRVAPNKRPEDLVCLVSFWRRFIAPDVRLVLAGKLPRSRAYLDALRALAFGEGMTPEDVLFLGHVDHADLLACYRSARVFVSMSEHEGFGVPLVESMLMRVPVLAYAAAAVPYTLGGAGVLFTEKCLPEVAELAHRLATDEAVRQPVLAAQDRRLAAFAPETIEASLHAFVASL